MDQARERNSKGYTVYKKAYQSMKTCPLPFNHPSDAQILNGLGPKLCDRLADKLQEYCDENGLPMPTKTKGKKKRPTDAVEDNEETEPARPEKKQRKAKLYVPKLRSGPYAIVLALATLDEDSGQALSKSDLVGIAQQHCDSSFTTPSDPTKFFTAWNSMDTLLKKELVCTRGHPTKRYYLSDEGWEVARGMQRANGEPTSPQKSKGKRAAKETQIKKVIVTEAEPMRPVTNKAKDAEGTNHVRPPGSMTSFDVLDLSSDAEAPDDNLITTQQAAKTTGNWKTLFPAGETITLPPQSFEVRLVLDTREVRTTTDRDYISTELKETWCDAHTPGTSSRRCSLDSAGQRGPYSPPISRESRRRGRT